MSAQPIRHNEIFFANRSGFQSNVNSSFGSDDMDTIEMRNGNGYLPPFLRSENMKFALPAEYYLPAARQQARYPQKPLVDVFPAPQALNEQPNVVIQPSGYFMSPNPNAFPTIPGCPGGNPVIVQEAMLRNDVTFYN